MTRRVQEPIIAKIPTPTDYLEQTLTAYLERAARAGTSYKCLEEDGSSDDALVIEGEQDMVIRIQGPIDNWYGVSAGDIIAELDKHNPQSIMLLIDSPGGMLSEGLAMYADLRARAKEGVTVKAEARGVVASAAILPFVAADTRTMGDGAMLMIHNPWAFLFAIGDADDIKSEADSTIRALNAHTGNYADIIVARTDIAKGDIRQAMKDETWYNASESIDAGFADEGQSDLPAEASDEVKIRAQKARIAQASSILKRVKRN